MFSDKYRVCPAKAPNLERNIVTQPEFLAFGEDEAEPAAAVAVVE